LDEPLIERNKFLKRKNSGEKRNAHSESKQDTATTKRQPQDDVESKQTMPVFSNQKEVTKSSKLKIDATN